MRSKRLIFATLLIVLGAVGLFMAPSSAKALPILRTAHINYVNHAEGTTRAYSNHKAAQNSPFCVRCNRPTGSCVGGSSGGFTCRTLSCSRCQIYARCGDRPRPGFEGFTSAAPVGFTINTDTIRQIAQTHPRFASILADVNRANWLGIEWGITHTMVGISLSATDIEYWLADPEAPGVAEWFKSKDVESLSISSVGEYEVGLKASEGGFTVFVKATQTVPGDPPYNILLVTLQQAGNSYSATSIQFFNQ